MVQGCWSPSVRATASTAGCVLAHAVATDGYATTSVPSQATAVCLACLARLGVTPDAVHPTSPVPASECADCEAGTAVSAGAWELERDSLSHRFHLGV